MAEKKRFTEKFHQPPEEFIQLLMGEDAWLGQLLPEIQAIWINCYPCGSAGGWLNHSVERDDELPGLIRLVGVKVKPKKK